MHYPHHSLALACLFLATLFTSTAGVLVRWVESADGWTVLFWRAAFFVATLLVWVTLRYRGRLVRMALNTGWPGVLMAVSFALATIAFIFALLETTVAKVVLISGTGWPTLSPVSSRCSPSIEATGVPPMSMIMSPGTRPATSAGDPFCTSVTSTP